MRSRLVAALVGVALAVLALVGIPHALTLQDLARAESRVGVERTADLAAARVEAVIADDGTVTRDVLGGTLEDGQRIEYVPAGGVSRAVPAELGPRAADLTASRATSQGGRLTVSLSQAALDREVREALLPLLVLAVVLVPLVAVAGLVLAARLRRPFAALCDAAGSLGTGRLDIDMPRSSLPEADAVGRALEGSAHRLDARIRREREHAHNASHQLRTPITALRLTLEDLALWPQTPPDVADELHRIIGEVDRFADAVATVLEEGRSGRLAEAEQVDLSELAEDAVARWRPVAEAVGLHLALAAGPERLVAQLPRAAVAQTVDLLIQHACEVGSGEVWVGCGDRGSHLAVEVSFAQRHPDWHGAPAAFARGEAEAVASAVGGLIATEPPHDDAVDQVLVLLLPSATAAQTLA